MEFERELEESGYIHRPLPVHSEDSLEWRIKQKEIGKRNVLWEGGLGLTYRLTEQGTSREIEESKERLLEIKAPLQCQCWPKNMPQDGDCAYYGRIRLAFYPEQGDWSSFNRLRFRIKPECEGVRVVTLSLYLINDGVHKIPDQYKREGFHLCVCDNHLWNDCIWEFPSLPRDCVTEFGLQYRLSGRDTSSGEDAVFLIESCSLEQTKKEELEEGWMLPENQLAYNTAGYGSKEEKYAVLNTKEEEFQIEDDRGRILMNQKLGKVNWQGREYKIAEFTKLKEGSYRLRCGNILGDWFPVNERVWEELIYKGLNFLFCERCGYPVPGKHGLCHMDAYGEHQGLKIPYCGGWHDAGDMSQQTAQTAETVESLLELAGTILELKGNCGLYQRVVEEALWGLEFVLRTRFGDGYRAASLGLIRYTDGKLGNEDDAANVRVHNHAMENFICAGVEALAGEMLADYDRELSRRCIQAAKEDFAFAVERFESFGLELPIRWEHTYDSSKTLMYGEICLSASRIYSLTGESFYKDKAAQYGCLLTECQQTEPGEAAAAGFFYRDEHKCRILHYCHQSREHVPAAAWRKLCQTQPDHRDRKRWERGLDLYGQYLKRMHGASSPYGMLPAGIYSLAEAGDQETFWLQHIQADYEKEKENYKEQVKQGIPLSGDYYIRQFPVWFSFRGNTAHMLSMAKAAAITGDWKKDRELTAIAAAQKDWLFGKNPFCRSLMYGAGRGYEALYSVFPGICVGQLPVGIQTKENKDVPYWPMANNSTYKEVWVTSLSRFFGVMAEILKNQN